MAELQTIEAMLLQAKADYVAGNPGEEDFESARRWLFSRSKRSGSVTWACTLLGLDVERIRRQAEAEHQAVQAVRKR